MPTHTSRSLGPLYDVVAGGFPAHRTKAQPGSPGNLLDVPRLAGDMNMSCEGVYKWFRSNTISARAALRLIGKSKKRLTFEDLKKFVKV